MSLDEACQQFEKVKELTIRLAEIENSAYRLAYNIKKTQKRANALSNITIPKYENCRVRYRIIWRKKRGKSSQDRKL